MQELGHDVADSVDIVMAGLLNAKRAQLPSYVMLPPPIAQLYRTSKKVVRSFRMHGKCSALLRFACCPCVHATSAYSPRAFVPERRPAMRRWLMQKRDSSVNPSDVAAHGMKLPLQRILRPIKDKLLADALSAEAAAAPEDILCGNDLFALQPPEDAPAEIIQWPPAHYLPHATTSV